MLPVEIEMLGVISLLMVIGIILESTFEMLTQMADEFIVQLIISPLMRFEAVKVIPV